MVCICSHWVPDTRCERSVYFYCRCAGGGGVCARWVASAAAVQCWQPCVEPQQAQPVPGCSSSSRCALYCHTVPSAHLILMRMRILSHLHKLSHFSSHPEPTQYMPQLIPDRQVKPADCRQVLYCRFHSTISHHDAAELRILICLAGAPLGSASAPEAATTAGFAGLPPAAELAGVSAMTANNASASIAAESMCRQHSWPLSLEPGQNQFTIQVTASQVCVKLYRDMDVYLSGEDLFGLGRFSSPFRIISGMQGRAIYVLADVL